MIFLDSNIPMYLQGGAHPHKADAQMLVERLIAQGERMVTDAEVLQEILHRYAALKRLDAVADAFRVVLRIVDEVFPIERSDVLRAAEIIQSQPGFSARDALHIAVMERREVRVVLSFDADFDRWPGIQRLHSL